MYRVPPCSATAWEPSVLSSKNVVPVGWVRDSTTSGEPAVRSSSSVSRAGATALSTRSSTRSLPPSLIAQRAR